MNSITDIYIGLARIKAANGGWILPGGKFTTCRKEAVEAAQKIHKAIEGGHQ